MFSWDIRYNSTSTGESFSEALILKSINPQYDDRLFIDSWVQYKKTPSSEHVVYKDCFECQNKKQCLYTTCSEVGIVLYWTQDSMNNLSSYCGLVDARIRASDKDLPVPKWVLIVRPKIPQMPQKISAQNVWWKWRSNSLDCISELAVKKLMSA